MQTCPTTAHGPSSVDGTAVRGILKKVVWPIPRKWPSKYRQIVKLKVWAKALFRLWDHGKIEVFFCSLKKQFSDPKKTPM